MPCRDGSILHRFLEDFELSDVVNHDVVEQTMPRPTADDAQQAMYSGKKKVIPTKTK